MRFLLLSVLLVGFCFVLSDLMPAGAIRTVGLDPRALASGAEGAPQEPRPRFDCGLHRSSLATKEYVQMVRSGEITRKSIPGVAPRNTTRGAAGRVGPDDLFLYEDTNSLLLTNFSDSELIDLLVDAMNSLLIQHGDNFDFVGFWLNFDPHHLIGAAFYGIVENDVTGIGDIGAFVGQPPTFNLRPDLGLAGDHIEGYIMMWNVNASHWVPGDPPAADFTRLALGQEFEHRFALFLPPLLDGRVMQGDDNICGRTLHWNWQIDGQGSSMEISEWVGANPAVPDGLFVNFNTDIPGGIFSYSDLYLMGYVTPAEMDAGNSELRFMEGSNCSSPFFGTISSFSSADIIASAGPRVPDSASEDKNYRTGWIMIHLPGQPPSSIELSKAAGILQQHSTDWFVSTLGRGRMNNTLPTDPVLSQTPLVLGQSVTLTVTNAAPGERVHFVYSTVGLGVGPCPPALGGLCLDILDPVVRLGDSLAGGNGTAAFVGNVPATAPLVTVHTQAAIPRGFGGVDSLKTNTVTDTIQP